MVHQSTSCEPSPAWTPGIRQRHTDPRPAPHSFDASRGARGQGQSRKRTGDSTEGLGGQGGIPGGGGEGAGRAERQRGELQGPLPKVARDAGDCAWPGAQWVGGDGHQLSGADGEAPRPGYPGDTGEPLGISAGTCSPGPQGSLQGPAPQDPRDPQAHHGRDPCLGSRKCWELGKSYQPLGSVQRDRGKMAAEPGPGNCRMGRAQRPPTALSGLGSLWRHSQPRPQTADPDPQGTLHWARSTNVPSLLAQGKSQGSA